MLARAARCTALRKAALPRAALPQARSLATGSKLGPEPEELAPGIPENDDMATGMERQEILQTPDIFWSRQPIGGHRGTKDNPAIVPSFNTSRVVGLETEQGVIWFKLEKGPLHLVDGQYFKLQQLDGGDH